MTWFKMMRLLQASCFILASTAIGLQPCRLDDIVPVTFEVPIETTHDSRKETCFLGPLVQHQSKGVGEADFARQDESTDTGFYSQPRICTHVDDS